MSTLVTLYTTEANEQVVERPSSAHRAYSPDSEPALIPGGICPGNPGHHGTGFFFAWHRNGLISVPCKKNPVKRSTSICLLVGLSGVLLTEKKSGAMHAGCLLAPWRTMPLWRVEPIFFRNTVIMFRKNGSTLQRDTDSIIDMKVSKI